MSDIRTVMWKEWKELVAQRGTLAMLAIYLVLFAVIMPAQQGEEWLRSPVGVAQMLFVPLFAVLAIVADSFAGERERHTLDTLLAGQLPDSAILTGKVLTGVLYGWTLTLVGLAASVVSVNLTAKHDGLLMYDRAVLLGAIGLSLGLLGLVTALGILVSLRASTVRQAQQALSLSLFALGGGAVVLAAKVPENWRRAFSHRFSGLGSGERALAATLLLLVLDAIVLAVVAARFRRPRLITAG